MSAEESEGASTGAPRSPSAWGRLAKVAVVLTTTLVVLAVAELDVEFLKKRAAAPSKASVVEAGGQRPGFLDALSEKADGDVAVIDDDVGFDCNVGYSNWRDGWSTKKRQYCCEHADKGCMGGGIFTPLVVGLIVGTVVAASCVMVWAIWRKRTERKGGMKWTGQKEEGSGYCMRCCGASG